VCRLVEQPGPDPTLCGAATASKRHLRREHGRRPGSSTMDDSRPGRPRARLVKAAAGRGSVHPRATTSARVDRRGSSDAVARLVGELADSSNLGHGLRGAATSGCWAPGAEHLSSRSGHDEPPEKSGCSKAPKRCTRVATTSRSTARAYEVESLELVVVAVGPAFRRGDLHRGVAIRRIDVRAGQCR